MTTEKRPTGAYRKDFYSIFEGMVGREMKPQEHAFLKAMMQNYLNDHEEDVLAAKMDPREHSYTCKVCGGKTVGFGKKFKNKMKSIKDPVA